MVHGEEKARDMARSLLPSTGRKAARKVRACIHRAARRGARLEALRFEHDPEAFQEAPGPARTSDFKIGYMVQRRRQADKLNPFLRWAAAVTRELPRESRMSHVQGLLPKGVIGEHAVSHMGSDPAFETPSERARREALWGRRPQAEWMDRGAQAELLRTVLQAPGGHRAFNHWLRARAQPLLFSQHDERRRFQGTTPIRMLLGAHDVLPFLDELGEYVRWFGGRRAWQPRYSHSEAFGAMEMFLRAFKKCGGDVKATLAALGVKAGSR
jgi:hypothetical protein